MKVVLNSFDKAKNFVRDVSCFETDIDLISSRFVIDAKSLLGILSLDLTKPIEVRVINPDEEVLVAKAIEKYAEKCA